MLDFQATGMTEAGRGRHHGFRQLQEARAAQVYASAVLRAGSAPFHHEVKGRQEASVATSQRAFSQVVAGDAGPAPYGADPNHDQNDRSGQHRRRHAGQSFGAKITPDEHFGQKNLVFSMW